MKQGHIPFIAETDKIGMCPYFPCLLRIDDWVASSSPCFHAAGEALRVLITHRYDLVCLTGRCLLVMSASVKNDLLIP
jgi:hypothetical protein